MTTKQELEALREAERIVESLMPQVADQHGSALLSNIAFYLGGEAEQLNLYMISMERP